MESLDRPYGDDEEAYRTVEPELTSETGAPEPPTPNPTSDLDERAGDPAFEAVIEAGGGVSEGFEVAEGQLVENIENAPDADRTADAFDLDEPGTAVDDDRPTTSPRRSRTTTRVMPRPRRVIRRRSAPTPPTASPTRST